RDGDMEGVETWSPFERGLLGSDGSGDMEEAFPNPLSDLPLTFKGRLTAEDVVHIRRYRGLILLRRSLRWVGRAFLTLMAALCAMSIVYLGPHAVSIAVIACCSYL